jgi:chromosomal replication initiation ATPase DnaA
MTDQAKITIAREVIQQQYSVDLEQRTRKMTVVKPRMLYYKWLSDNTGLGVGKIGKTLVLKQDHSTVLNALKNFNNLMSVSGEFDVEWDSLNEKINEQIKNHFK